MNIDGFASAVTDVQMSYIKKRMDEVEKSNPDKKWTTRELVAIGMEVDPLSLSKILGEHYAQPDTKRRI